MPDWLQSKWEDLRSFCKWKWRTHKVLISFSIASAMALLGSAVAGAHLVSLAIVLLWVAIFATTQRPQIIRRSPMTETALRAQHDFGLPRSIAQRMVEDKDEGVSEKVLEAERLHPVSILKWMLLAPLGPIILIGALIIDPTAQALEASAIIAVGFMATAAWKYIAYQHTWVILTSIRLAKFWGVFRDNGGGIPIGKIDSIGITEGMLSRQLFRRIGVPPFADLAIESAAEVESVGNSIPYVRHPNKFHDRVWVAIGKRHP